jgi:hypothetical protein
MLKYACCLAMAFMLATNARAQQWGDLTATFLYKGNPPAPKKLQITKDEQFCGKHNVVDETLVVNEENKGIANVVVFLADSTKPKIHPDYDKPEVAKAEVKLDNENCRFEPRVVAMRNTQTLIIGNKDEVGHNTKADLFNNTPFNDLVPASGSIKKTFTKQEAMPGSISCSIHPWMNAYLLVREDPYFAVSDRNGKIEIKNLPAGEHTFVVWSNKLLSNVAVDGKPTTWSRGRVKVNIKPGANSLGNVEITTN